MAASADELLKNDNFQIPLIDLQRFCQDELNVAARLFGDFPKTKFSSMVSPKIDKSTFNESAGSRRQTYSGDRVSRRRKKPILNSHAKEFNQEISMNSLVNFSSSKGKLGINKNSSKSILDLVGKFLYILNKEEKNRLSVRSSLSSHASEERDFENSFENAEGLDEDKSKAVDNAHPDIPNARKIPQVSKGDSELTGGMGRVRMLSEALKRSQEGQNKVAVNSNLSIAESGNAYEEVLGRDTEGGIWVNGEENIDTQHGLQVQSQERQLYEQVKASLKDFDRLVETSELQNRGKVYEKQSQADTICAELHRYILNAEGDINTAADGMDRPKRMHGRSKKKTIVWGSALSIDTKKGDCKKELASQAGEHLASDSRKRVRSGSPCSASKEYGGDHFSSDSRKRFHNGLSHGASKDDNGLGVDRQFYHRIFSSEAATLDGKEVSSDASVAGDIITKPTGPDIDRATNEKCKVDLTERANLAAAAFDRKQLYGAKLKKEKMANRKNERGMLRQMSCMKKQKILPADDFLESWKNRLPNGCKVERTESGKNDYYHKFVSLDGLQFPELKETSNYESSVCRQEDDVKGSSGTNEIELCNIYPAGYRGSNQRIDISHEEERIEELNSSSKLDSLESMSIPSGSDGARTEACIYVCKHCNCYRHCVDHVAANDPTSHRKRGRPRLRGKVQNVSLPEKKEDKDDQIISNENLQSTSVKESDNPDNLNINVGRPRVRGSDCHKGMHCNIGIQSGHAMFYVNQAGSKENVNEPQNSNSIDMDCGHAILSGDTPMSVNTVRLRKPERPRKIKEPICGHNIKDDNMNHTDHNRDDLVDTDSAHVMQSAGTPVLVNTFGAKRKPGRLRMIKEPICSNNSHANDMNNTANERDEANNFRSYQDVDETLSMCKQSVGLQTSIDRDAYEKIDGLPSYGDKTQDEVYDFVDADCGHGMQSAGTPVLGNTIELEGKHGQLRIVVLKRKPGRLRRIKEPICSNDNHDDERDYTDIDRDEANNFFRSYQDVEESLSMFEQSADLQTSIDRHACEKIDGLPRYGDKSRDEVHYFVDTDGDHDTQSVGTPVLVNTVGPKRKPGQQRKIKDPSCRNDNHDNDKNYSGNDRDETNNSVRSYQDVEENLSVCKQSAGVQTAIDQDACEKIDELPRRGDKSQAGVHYFADTDCFYATLSAGTPVLVNRIEAKRKPGQPREIKEPICSNDNHDDERNCTSNDRDEANNSFSSYKDVKENLSMCKQSAGLQNSIDRDACEKKDGLPRYGHKNQDEVHSENSIESVGVLALVDQDGQNIWAGQQRLIDDSEDTTGNVAFADPSLKRDDWSRLKDEMQVKDMDCSNDRQPLGAQVLVTQVGEKQKVKPGWLRKFQVPICSDSKLDDKINIYSSSGNQDEERHCQCDDKKHEMRISLDGELNFSKTDHSMHAKAPAFLDMSENFIGMQKLGKISQDEEMPCARTIQHVGLATNLDPDEQNKWFEQPRVKDDRQDVELSYDRNNQRADSKNPVDSTSPSLEEINLDSTLQEHAIYQNSSKITEDCFAEAGTLFHSANLEKLDPNKFATGGNAQVPFFDDEIEWDSNQFVVCQWCGQDFDFSSVSHLGSPCSWICPGCTTVNNGSSF